MISGTSQYYVLCFWLFLYPVYGGEKFLRRRLLADENEVEVVQGETPAAHPRLPRKRGPLHRAARRTIRLQATGSPPLRRPPGRCHATSHPPRLQPLKPRRRRRPTPSLRPHRVTRRRWPPKSPGPPARKAPAGRNPRLPDAPADHGRTISLHLSAQTWTRHDFGMVLRGYRKKT